jgi:hypothetical protein
VWYPKLPFERRLAIEMEAIGLGSTHAVFGPPQGAAEIELKPIIQEMNCARMRLHSDIVNRIPEITEHNERCEILQKVERMIEGRHRPD